MIDIWEWEFDKLKKTQSQIFIVLQGHSRISGCKLEPRNTFFEGRTENFVTSFKTRDWQIIKYTDICSFYPHICKTEKFSTGHPELYVGTECLELIREIKIGYFTPEGFIPLRDLYIYYWITMKSRRIPVFVQWLNYT